MDAVTWTKAAICGTIYKLLSDNGKSIWVSWAQNNLLKNEFFGPCLFLKTQLRHGETSFNIERLS